MNKTRIWTVAVTVGLGAAVAFGARASRADDDERGEGGFNNRTIKGDWGFVTSVGRLPPPVAPHAVDTAGVGRIHFDGEGGCAVSTVTNVDGRSAAFHSSTCHYSVNADGTGTSEAVFPDSPIAEPIPVAFVIVQRGKEIMFTNTRFMIATFVAHRQ